MTAEQLSHVCARLLKTAEVVQKLSVHESDDGVRQWLSALQRDLLAHVTIAVDVPTGSKNSARV